MDSEISDLVKKMDFAGIPEAEGYNDKEGLTRRSARLKHGSVPCDLDSDSTVDSRNLVVREDRSENKNSFAYSENKMTLPTYEINRPSANRLFGSNNIAEDENQMILHTSDENSNLSTK